MTIAGYELWQILDILILLLIGMGPKVAMVPFVEMTSGLDGSTRKKVANKMIKTATVWAIILVVFGSFLMKLLHFSEEALYIAGGIVFVLLALHMLTAGSKTEKHDKVTKKEAERMANYPLAVPYLLNPAGITMLVIFSGATDRIDAMFLLIVLVLIMAAFDWLVFTNLDRLIKHLDSSRLAVTEAIFGILLSALGIELILLGLSNLGVIETIAH
jgi:MarC family membrane protein